MVKYLAIIFLIHKISDSNSKQNIETFDLKTHFNTTWVNVNTSQALPSFILYIMVICITYYERHWFWNKLLYTLNCMLSQKNQLSVFFRLVILNGVQQCFSYILAVSFIGGGNLSTQRKPQNYHKSLTNFIT